jgi:hypothetical protein
MDGNFRICVFDEGLNKISDHLKFSVCRWQREKSGVSFEAKAAWYYIVADDEKEF